jgi:LysR family glycine cleavage system transcriptional activator
MERAVASPRPPLGDLVVFEAAARRLSFTKAADELGVTQGAVSQRVRLLEFRLGLPLFERRVRAVVLTAEGVLLARAMADALGRVDDALVEIGASDGGRLDGVLRVHLTTSLAIKWLVPRLARFAEVFPGIDVRVLASSDPPDFAAGAADLAMVFDAAAYDGLVVTPLMDDVIVPVASPDLVRGLDLPLSPQAILGFTRLYNSNAEVSGSGGGWVDWLAAVGAAAPRGRAQRFNQAHLAIQAAVDGQGVAMGRGAFVARDLARGRLVMVSDRIVRTRFAHHVVHPPRGPAAPRVAAFVAWLREEAAPFHAAASQGRMMDATEVAPASVDDARP